MILTVHLPDGKSIQYPGLKASEVRGYYEQYSKKYGLSQGGAGAALYQSSKTNGKDATFDLFITERKD